MDLDAHGEPASVRDRAADRTAPSLLAAPGFVARRLYQAYLAAWVREVSSSLTGPQFAVLTQVQESPGIDQSTLAGLVSLDTSTMTDVAHRLEAKGLLRRPVDTADGRRKLLFLTEEGTLTLADTTERASALNARLMQPFSPKQGQELLDDLTALTAQWEQLASSADSWP